METIRNLYRIGRGPSSSHTLAPSRASEKFKAENPEASSFRVTLYGSLAATGKGHLTDKAVEKAFSPINVEILWEPQTSLPKHPNGMRLEALDSSGQISSTKVVYSVGGGAIWEEGLPAPEAIYEISTLKEIMNLCEENGLSFWEYVNEIEGLQIWDHLRDVWKTMNAAIERGLAAEGVLAGGLGLARKASATYRKARMGGKHYKQAGYLSAYALAVSEENAAGEVVVTAPTCGSSGVIPSVLRYLQETLKCSDDIMLRGLATAGLIGNLVKHNASISGAEVGCQGEIGTACSMAAGAAAQIMGGTNRQIEYAAEMGLEHFLGLTCDPISGLVQIPCIERNPFAASRAVFCADFALFSDGSHRVPFDEVVAVMRQTGHDLPSLYRETASGGLAEAYRTRLKQ